MGCRIVLLTAFLGVVVWASPAVTGVTAAPQEDAGSRVVLAELFTDSNCGPCVAADLGFERILENYRRDEVAVLEYHIDITGPDPLSTAEGERRSIYYMGPSRSAPQAFFDGGARMRGGGGRSASRRFWSEARDRIDAAAEKAPAVQLSVRAALGFEAGLLEVNLSATRPLISPDLRLHVVFYRDGVEFRGMNGLGVHRYVVESMLDGADGAAVTLQDVPVQLRMRLGRQQLQGENRGLVLFAQDPDSRVVYQARAIEFGTSVADAREVYNEGTRLARAGDLSAAADRFFAAVELDPDSAIGHAGLGAAYARLGRREDGCASFERALERDPRMVNLHLDLADMYVAGGSPGKAVEHLETFLDVAGTHPRAPAARQLLEEIRSRTGG